METRAGSLELDTDGWHNWRDPHSRFFAEPRNHALAPGGSEYSRYEWVRDQIEPGSKILDVGCNCGQLAINLKRDLDCEMTGVDAIPEFIQHCHTLREQPFSWLYCEDFSSVFATWWLVRANFHEYFDYVTALEVIEHPMDLRGFRNNARMALKPGGKLIITVPHPDGFVAELSYAAHVRQWTKWRLEQVFGPMIACQDIYRDECGRLLSMGAVFDRTWDRRGAWSKL